MCGIAGIVNRNRAPVSRIVLKRMTDAIRHRGPDGEGFWLDGNVGLGHRRLAIIDLTNQGRQPMQTQDGRFVITYNGEVFNFKELRLELRARGHSFRSETDTEVVLAAYVEWGPRCVERFNGQFAFGIHDRLRKKLFLARDRYGLKPLYYCLRAEVFLFASELKAFLQYPSFERAVDPNALLEYFTFQNIFTDRTLLRDVHLLPPGHTAVLNLQANSFDSHRYWDFDFVEPERPLSMAEYEEELDHLFAQAVRRQLVSDVPIGAYLSGGIDSGAITAVAARQLPYMPTFTGGFDLSSACGLELGYDERARAEALSYRFKTEQYEVVMKAGDMERAMPELIWHLEDLRVGQCYPNYYVSKLAGKFVKVVLAGTGSDELFAGYPWRYYSTANSLDFEEYVKNYYHYWQRLVRNQVILQLFQPNVWNDAKDILTIDTFRTALNHGGSAVCSPEEYVNRSLYFECKTFLHGLLVVEDKLSMAFGLESRIPFLDNDLVDLAMRLPVRSKLRDMDRALRIDENDPRPKRDLYHGQTSDGKVILRNVLGRYFPGEYANGKKQGFSGPDASWFRGDSIEYVRDLLLNDDAAIYEYLRPDTVKVLVDDHLSGRQNRRLFIWSLISFEWWLRQFVGAPAQHEISSESSEAALLNTGGDAEGLDYAYTSLEQAA